MAELQWLPASFNYRSLMSDYPAAYAHNGPDSKVKPEFRWKIDHPLRGRPRPSDLVSFPGSDLTTDPSKRTRDSFRKHW